MVRPARNLVEYFPHDTHASFVGKTIKIMEGAYGVSGYAFWFKLLEYLGGACEGHYYDARNDVDLEFLLRELHFDVVSGTGMLDKLAFLGAIDSELWKLRIIWCQKFVDRISDVYKKRGRPVPLKPRFCNGNIVQLDTTTSISVTETPIPVTEIPQSKVKYIKVKYIKEIDKENDVSDNHNKNQKEKSKQPYGEFKNVMLSDEELQKLKERFTTDGAAKRIETLSVYMKSKGVRKYKDHYATILNWARREGNNEKTKRNITADSERAEPSDEEKRRWGVGIPLSGL